LEEKYSLDEAKTIKTGVITLIVVLLIAVVTISRNASIKSQGMGDKYNIYASFGRTDGLNIGDAVRMSGVDIGRVIGAKLDDNYNSNLILEIDGSYKIPDDSSASIVSFGLIGGKYVEIEVGGSEDFIEPEGVISYTQDAMVLEELLDRMIALGKSKRTKDSANDSNEGEDNE
jgi:phospholipid/cholesterol/gamma-HCH transport system substrate-binding protein